MKKLFTEARCSHGAPYPHSVTWCTLNLSSSQVVSVHINSLLLLNAVSWQLMRCFGLLSEICDVVSIVAHRQHCIQRRSDCSAINKLEWRHLNSLLRCAVVTERGIC